jgi:predicted ATPase
MIEHGLCLDGHRTSAGVRLLLVYVALAYHPGRPKVILVEEPETGFHPRRLGAVVDLLRAITRGEHGGFASQVILTTHSPYLLDLVDIDQDQVLVFRRAVDGSRTVEPADANRLKIFLDEFKLGEVWYNQEEEGLVARQK